MVSNVYAVLEERILETFRHKNVASENAAQRRSFNFIDTVSEVVLSLILLHCQLKLADSLFDLDFEDHVLSLLLSQAIVHLNDLVTFAVTHLIDCCNGFLEMIE